MKKSLILIFIITVIISCNKKTKYENTNELCNLLGEMTENDQKYRGMSEMTDPFFEILDSLKTINNISKNDYTNLSREQQLEWEKKARKIANKYSKTSEKIKDSLMNLQIEIDDKNTEILIDIIKEKGWVTKNGLGCKEYVSTFLIFRHSQEKYWGEIRKLIEKEKSQNRIGNGDYMMIDDHIKGRPMTDFNTLSIE
jgi:hypothetical protein